MTETVSEEIKSGRRTKFGSSKKFLVVVTILLLAGFAAWSFINYRQSEREILRLSSLEGQQDLAEQNLADLLEKVKAHMILPEGEEPVVATISDVEALLENNAFFEGAQNGDRVIVYAEAQQAIVYSPTRDLIVSVGPVVTGGDQVTEGDVAGASESQDKPEEE